MWKALRFALVLLLAQLSSEAIGAPILGIGAAGIPGREKSVASGLYMSGQFTYVLNNGVANITLDAVNNDSPIFVTGTLRLSLWAVAYQPDRGSTFVGTRMAVFPIASPLGPRSSDINILGSASYVAPPAGTYWLILALEEYDPTLGCSADGWCFQDTFQSYLQTTFGPALPAFDYSDLWWNPNESGWGMVVEQHPSNIAFIAWYTYDGNGNPKWYVGPDCVMVGDGCTSTLYQTTGPPFGPTFNPAAVTVQTIGSVTLSFTDRSNGYMSYNVNGSVGVKAITREPF